jgi:DNA-binding XRE family transcriptional regulator
MWSLLLEAATMAELITKVGRYKVKDGSAPGPEDSETVDLTMAEGLGYERRAAHVVFVEAKEVGGAELKFARKALGLRQTELGEMLGMSEFSISHMESDRMNVQRTTQLAVAALLAEALQGPPWPPNAWIEAKTKSRPSVFEVPRKRKTG